MKKMSLNCLAHVKVMIFFSFFLNSKLCQFALIFCLCKASQIPAHQALCPSVLGFSLSERNDAKSQLPSKAEGQCTAL